MSLFAGTGVALVTPFNEDGSIDEISLRNLVEHVITGGVDNLLALGTTSEVVTMTEDERSRVMDIILDQNAGRKPVIIGIGGNNTAKVADDIKACPYLKDCAAVLSVVPYYNKPNQNGIFGHFSMIAEASPIPVILYNIPGRTGINMTAETTLRLANKYSNIVGIKEASGCMQTATDILRGCPADFAVLSGDDAIALPMVSIGGQGVISVLANLYPEGMSEMMHLALANDTAKAARYHLQYAEWYKVLFAEGNPAGIKSALYAQGIIKHSTLRLPLAPVSDTLFQRIKGLL